MTHLQAIGSQHSEFLESGSVQTCMAKVQPLEISSSFLLINVQMKTGNESGMCIWHKSKAVERIVRAWYQHSAAYADESQLVLLFDLQKKRSSHVHRCYLGRLPHRLSLNSGMCLRSISKTKKGPKITFQKFFRVHCLWVCATRVLLQTVADLTVVNVASYGSLSVLNSKKVL